LSTAAAEVGRTTRGKYGAGAGVAWCAYFGTWVWIQAGVPGAHRESSVSTLRDSWSKRFAWVPWNGSGTPPRPEPGDFAIYKRGGYSHVNIVVEVLGDGSYRTIGGNEYGGTGTSAVRRSTWSIAAQRKHLSGFLKPIGLASPRSHETAVPAADTLPLPVERNPLPDPDRTDVPGVDLGVIFFGPSTASEPFDHAAWIRSTISDITYRPAGGSQVGQWLTAAAAGSSTDAMSVANLLESSSAGRTQRSLARLYAAYFMRTPDAGGLDYWYRQLILQGKGLRAVSDSFAASAEFRQRYGQLSDAAFVDRVYSNVLGRPADAAGRSYWTSQLASRRTTRGGLMVGFSESAEFKGRTASDISTIQAFYALLRRVPTATELTRWRQTAPTSAAPIVESLFSSVGFRTRIAAGQA
jgi:hypothetical protein